MNTNERTELFDHLKILLPAQLQELCFKCGLHTNYLEQNASAVKIAIDLYNFAENNGKLDTLARLSGFQPPSNPSVTKTFLNKLPESDAPFLGRSRELALLNQAWQAKGLLVLVAWGGVGKTRLVARWLDGLSKRGWAGAARVYAWSFYSQGAAEDRQVSADAFVDHALCWFGNRDALTDLFAKTERLAELLQAQPSLLILEGLEPLQHPLGTHDGEVKDKAQVFLQPRSVGTRKEKYPFLG